MALCHILAQQPVGADDLGLGVAAKRRVQHQQMVAIPIDNVEVALLLHGLERQPGAHFLDKDLVAKPLRRLDLGPGRSQPDVERPDPAEQTRRVSSGCEGQGNGLR
jgi:hypothetical protein